jgi:predicted amino acid-binding ACT domain protein
VSECGGEAEDKVRMWYDDDDAVSRLEPHVFPNFLFVLMLSLSKAENDDDGEITLNVTVSGAHTGPVTCAIAEMIKTVPAKILDVEMVVVARRLTAIATLVADSSKKAHDSIAKVHAILAPLHVDIAIDCVSGAWGSPSFNSEAVVEGTSSGPQPASVLSAAVSSASAANKATLVITAIKEAGVSVAFIADVLQSVQQFQCRVTKVAKLSEADLRCMEVRQAFTALFARANCHNFLFACDHSAPDYTGLLQLLRRQSHAARAHHLNRRTRRR